MSQYGSRIIKIIESSYFFLAVLLLNILFLCLTRFYPTQDGPAHLYNTNLLKSMLLGNEFLKDYFAVNRFWVPNWTSHSALLLLRLFLPGWMAEKMLIAAYVSGLAFSFRFLVIQFDRERSYLSLLVFPLIHSLLFHMGFYNFSISFIFFFLTVGYYRKILDDGKALHYALLFLLFTLTYYSNVLVYSFLGLTTGTMAILHRQAVPHEPSGTANWIKPVARRLLLLLAVTLPTLVLMVLFFKFTPIYGNQASIPPRELLKWLNDARPFIVYNYPREEIFTQQYIHVLVAFLAVMLFKKISQKSWRIRFQKGDVLLVPALLSLLLLFVIPNAAGAGMMTDRFALMFFMFLVAWFASRIEYSRLNHLLILVVLFAHVALIRQHHREAVKNMDQQARVIHHASQFLERNSVVLPVNFSDNWLQGHFANYLGADKPVMILENYEASVGFFPLKFKGEEFPYILLRDREELPGISWRNNPGSENRSRITHVFLYGNMSRLEDDAWKELKGILQEECALVHQSEDGFVRLYEVNP